MNLRDQAVDLLWHVMDKTPTRGTDTSSRVRNMANASTRFKMAKWVKKDMRKHRSHGVFIRLDGARRYDAYLDPTWLGKLFMVIVVVTNYKGEKE